MQQHELAKCLDWAAQEGWNPGLHDSETFFASDPEGFLLAELHGEAVGMISAVRYGSDFGFIGFYIVRPEFRGRGHGLLLWNAAINRLKGRLIGLDGVVAQQDNYRKSGFLLAYNNMRMQGTTGSKGPVSEDVVALDAVEPWRLVQYDAAMFPGERATFLRHWVGQTGSVALGLLQQNTLRGYGVIRPCRTGFKVGPLFANDTQAAASLLNALLSRVPGGEQVQFDIAAGHDAARDLALSWGMQPVFETARMYTGAAPALDLHRQYGITTFELG
ncbi:MAG: hypothetical protein RL300_1910 [Pseudomonadota bacterium]|jgi:GNAT superfamily N-acetyltransferase